MQTGHLVAKNDYPEANDYISSYVRSELSEDYIRIVREAKAKLTVPVIASINCTEAGSWVEFAERLRDAGADALEVNVMRLETELFADPAEIEAYYVSIVTALVGKGLPIIVSSRATTRTCRCSSISSVRAGAAAVDALQSLLPDRHRSES